MKFQGKFSLFVIFLTFILSFCTSNEESKTKRACKKWEPSYKLRVANGDTSQNKFQSTAALASLYTRSYQPKIHLSCTAVLITHSHAITAAHCVDLPYDRPLFIRFTKDFYDESQEKADYYVKNFYIHPNYGRLTLNYDLAILEVETTVQFTDWIKPACLVGKDFTNNFSLFRLAYAGFGNGHFAEDAIREPGKQITKYTNGPLRVADLEKEKNVNISQIIYKTTKNEEICTGDSGGGAQIEMNSGINIIVGIASSLNTITHVNPYCGTSIKFTNVTDHIDWIESIAFSIF